MVTGLLLQTKNRVVIYLHEFPYVQTFETIKRVQLEKYHSTSDPVEKAKIILNPWELMHKAVQNGTPFLETTPVKRGGHTYQVPVPIREKRALAISIKWLIAAGKEKEDDMRFYKKFAYEIIDAANNSVSFEIIKICTVIVCGGLFERMRVSIVSI
jgi:hypothetical protein